MCVSFHLVLIQPSIWTETKWCNAHSKTHINLIMVQLQPCCLSMPNVCVMQMTAAYCCVWVQASRQCIEHFAAVYAWMALGCPCFIRIGVKMLRSMNLGQCSGVWSFRFSPVCLVIKLLLLCTGFHHISHIGARPIRAYCLSVTYNQEGGARGQHPPRLQFVTPHRMTRQTPILTQLPYVVSVMQLGPFALTLHLADYQADVCLVSENDRYVFLQRVSTLLCSRICATFGCFYDQRQR